MGNMPADKSPVLVVNHKLHPSNQCEDPSKSDVTLVIDGHEVPAHRLILSAESEFFRGMFYGAFAEKDQKVVELQEVSYPSFLLIVQYMYSKVVNLHDEELDVVLEAFELTHRFGLEKLEKIVKEFLMSILCAENVFRIFPMAKLLDDSLFGRICAFIDENLEQVLARDEFLKLHLGDAHNILSTKRKNVSEVHVFQRIEKWLEENYDWIRRRGESALIKSVDFSRLKISDIKKVVAPSKLYEDSFLFEIIQSKGFDIKAVTNCENSEYFQGTGDEFAVSTELTVNDKSLYGIIVELDEESHFNRIQMNICSVLGYKIEVKRQRNWVALLDYSSYRCRGFQDLYFPGEVKAKCIRISMTGGNFKCNSFKVFKASKCPKIKQGFICPVGNDETNAWVSQANHNMGHEFNVIWGNPHCIIEPCICFRQPYYVNVIQFRLWNNEHRNQTFKLSVVSDFSKKLLVLVDSKEEVNGWQRIVFKPMAVTYVEITGKQQNGDGVSVAFVQVSYDETLNK